MKAILQALALGFATVSLFAADAPIYKQSVFQLRLVSDGPAPDTERLILSSPVKSSEKPANEVLYVQKRPLMDHTTVRSAYVSTNTFTKQPEIGVEFSQQGKEHLAKLTTDNIGKRVAVFIDGKLQSAPRIVSPITGGRIAVDGRFTAEEAHSLVSKLEREAGKR
jgi:preprotein translocase subunit SecD